MDKPVAIPASEEPLVLIDLAVDAAVEMIKDAVDYSRPYRNMAIAMLEAMLRIDGQSAADLLNARLAD